ncbi:two-component sensor histidine kinase [Glaciihabitans arcticus]|uniref:histidine kinase n=2 Tax=Glaciihabitans arcticus TaxID=2668039 RepID=A0A4Q9H093_9MICO|nr:two-component sensor histidine kinase [Glaciihabitans arcticus]
MPRTPGVIRRFWARHPRLTDSLIAIGYWLGAIGLTLLTAAVPRSEVTPKPIPMVIAGLVVLTIAAGALLFRRSRPWIPVFAAWAGTLAAAPLIGFSDLALIPIAVYGLAIYRSARAAWIAYAASVPISTIAYLLSSPTDNTDTGIVGMTLDGGVPAAVFLLIVVLVAINIGNRRRYVTALIDRAARLEREREQLARLAALDERSRIAREMHDIVSHSLTVMVTLAEGSAAIAPEDAERARDGMRRVAETGRSALTDMRRMLGVLNENEVAELAPQPGVVDLHELVEGFRTAGLPVRFVSRGQEPGDPALQLAVYRIVQESLTNVLKHALGPADVEVDVRFRRGSTSIVVTDDGAPSTEPIGTGGHGTVGMRERVAVYGGTLESAPCPTRGWRLAATLNHDRSGDA